MFSYRTAPTRALRSGAALALTAAATIVAPASAQEIDWEPVAEGMPQTAAELNGFSDFTRHDEMWEYLNALGANTNEMRLGSYGETRQGRALPYAVFSRPLIAEPWEAMASGKPVVVLAANVHGGERTFREGLLPLMRELATPGTGPNALLDDLVVVVVPQINPDGFEATDRGSRGNAWGIDLNRDYVKLEHPSIRYYVENIISEWRPHLYVDGHNGGSFPYNLNYQCPSHFDPARELTLLCDQEIFPAIDAKLEEEGLKSWYYTGGNEEVWRVGGSQARIGRNYGGFVNSIAILFEAPRQELNVGARAGYLGYLAVLEYAAENAETLMGTVEAARAETLALGSAPSGQIAVEMTYEPEDYTVSYEIMNDDFELVEVNGAQLLKKPVATKLRDRPWAYLLPRDAVDAVVLLRRHGITVEELRTETVLNVRAYEIGDVTHEPQYNHAAATRIEVAGVVEVEQTFPAGTFVVPTAQTLGRLVTHMLEVETDDNVVYWNTMDGFVPRSGGTMIGSGPFNQRERTERPLVPIYKLMVPTTLDSHLVREVWR